MPAAVPPNTRFRARDVSGSLHALSRSLNQAALERLLDKEGVRGRVGAPLIGHVIASTTPLLAWFSAIRALLTCSASLVKLPSDSDCSRWAFSFRDLLANVDPGLASLIAFASWQGGDPELDAAFVEHADLLLVYGADTTVDSYRIRAAGKTRVIGYGHRVSCSVVECDLADRMSRFAWAIARDITAYDQLGCLSPQCVFVLGDDNCRRSFVSALGAALDRQTQNRRVTTDIAAQIGETRSMMLFEPGVRVTGPTDMRWTVVEHDRCLLHLSQGLVVVNVCSGERGDVLAAIRQNAGLIQGVSIASRLLTSHAFFRGKLSIMGISRVCAAGGIQNPGISWPENGIPVLSCLL
jgi:hypothetical protein